ncbi:hypothetical protein Q1695_008168 [Nippostrongylus brasiliensis]|nr:hypothetical protein Q1695_008168 [Nippostrongylus brasiliensis]
MSLALINHCATSPSRLCLPSPVVSRCPSDSRLLFARPVTHEDSQIWISSLPQRNHEPQPVERKMGFNWAA